MPMVSSPGPFTHDSLRNTRAYIREYTPMYCPSGLCRLLEGLGEGAELRELHLEAHLCARAAAPRHELRSLVPARREALRDRRERLFLGGRRRQPSRALPCCLGTRVP